MCKSMMNSNSIILLRSNGDLNSKFLRYMCKITLYTWLDVFPSTEEIKRTNIKRERKLALLTLLPPPKYTYAAYINRCTGTRLLKSIFILSSRTSLRFLLTHIKSIHFLFEIIARARDCV